MLISGATAADRLSNLLVPTTSEILWGIVSGDILSTAWQKLTSNTDSLMSIGFQQIAEITGTPFKQIFNYIGGGATYICYVNGAVASYTTAIKYPRGAIHRQCHHLQHRDHRDQRKGKEKSLLLLFVQGLAELCEDAHEAQHKKVNGR